MKDWKQLIAETDAEKLPYLEEHPEKVLQAVLNALYREYPKWKEEYKYELEEPESAMPDLHEPMDLLHLMTPADIRMLDVEKENHTYYGVQFRCSWDEDFRPAVIMYKDKVISITDGVEMMHTWIAENDRNSKDFEEIKSQKKMACNIRF